MLRDVTEDREKRPLVAAVWPLPGSRGTAVISDKGVYKSNANQGR
jgi:hypothetical protein